MIVAKKKIAISVDAKPSPRLMWRIKQGNTAIVEGAGRLILSRLNPETQYYLEYLEGMKLLVFAHYKGDTVELYGFHQYDHAMLPAHLLPAFCALLPTNIELVRPETTKKSRIFGESPLK
jgi:hypothetical protein